MKLTTLVAVSTLVAGCARSGTDINPIAAPATSDVRAIDLGPAVHASAIGFQPGAGGFAARRGTYHADVADGGAWTIKHAPSKRGNRVEGAPLRLETVGISRGGALAVNQGKVKAAGAETVAIDRGWAVESLKSGRSGIEQSWTFAAPPPVDPSSTGGMADLVVRVSASGHDFVEADSNGLKFRDPASQLVIRYGAASWVDARGDRTPILPRFENGQIVMTVPHDLVARTNFPAVLDPMVGPVLALSTQPDESSGIQPQVAYGNGVYATTWEDETNNVYSAHVQLVSAAGALIGSNISVAVNAAVEPRPAIDFDGTYFQLVWIDGAQNVIKGQRLTTAGAWQDGSPVTLDNATTEVKGNPQLAVNASGESLVVFNFLSSVNNQFATKAIRVQNGAAEGAEFIVQNGLVNGGSESYPNVASDGTNFVVVYMDAQNGMNVAISVRTVNATTGAVGSSYYQAMTTYSAGGAPSITFANGVYLVAWSDNRLGQFQDVFGNIFNPATNTFSNSPNGFAIDTAAEAFSQASAWDGANFVVPHLTFTTGGVAVQEVTVNGTLFGALYTAGWATNTHSPGIASGGAGKSLIAYMDNVSGHYRAVLFSSGMNGAPCTVNGDCDNGQCIANAPGVPGSTCCATMCSPIDSCHVAQCSTGTCTNQPISTCGTFSACEVTAKSACGTPPTDTDGDGLADVWEQSDSGPNSSPPHLHFADYNCDGVWEPGETLLPGANYQVPDIYAYYDYMGYGIEGNTCSTASDCTALGYAHHVDPSAAQGAAPACIHNQCVYTCNSNSDCTHGTRPGNHATELCQAFTDPNGNAFGNVCLHTHDPEVLAPGVLAQVTAMFFTRGYTLHVVRAASARPHSVVTSYRTDSVMTTTCEGGSLSANTAGPGKFAVSVYDLKNSPGSPFPQGSHVYHYGLFSHYAACDTYAHCSACPAAQNPDGTTKNTPVAGESGLAEISGNDFVVSLGQAFSDNGSNPGLFSIGSTFMHELGHNLGLHHAGGIDIPCHTTADCVAAGSSATCSASPTLPGYSFCFQSESPEQNYKPNYLSVMNYRYQFGGVLSAMSPGSIVPVGSRLDYSTITLPVGGNTPGSLDESNVAGTPASDPGDGLSESAGLGATGPYTADIFTFSDAQGSIPAPWGPVLGPVPWSGPMSTLMATNVEADLTCGVDHACPQLPEMGLPVPRLYGHTDWAPTWTSPASTQFTYSFQCLPFFGDGAPSEAIGLSAPAVTPSQAVQSATGCTPSPSTNCDTGSESGGSSGWGAPVPARIDVRPGCTNNWIDTATTSATVTYPGGGCQVCGGGYQCFSTNTSNFTDPSPANAVVSSVRINLNGTDCSGSTITVYVNGVAMGTTTPTETCSCGVCNAYPTVTYYTGDQGTAIPGWVAGGTNSLTVTTGNGSSTCLNNAVVTPIYGALTSTVTYAGGGCQVCGGTYSCFSTNTSTFRDPTPANSVVTEVRVALNGVNCNGSNVTISVDGNTLGTVNPGANCNCGVCQNFTSIGYINGNGIPNWVYGGSNTVTVQAASGVTCIANAVVSVTYGTLPVVIYGGALLDVTKIDTTNTKFGGEVAFTNYFSDIDGDGITDLTQQYPMAAMSNYFSGNSKTGTLRGVLTTGQLITGIDQITVTNNQPACTRCGGYDGDTQPGCWYMSALNQSCNSVCANRGGFNSTAATHNGNPICKAVYPEKANGYNWIAEECCSTDNNTDWGATGGVPDPTYSNASCHIACACNN